MTATWSFVFDGRPESGEQRGSIGTMKEQLEQIRARALAELAGGATAEQIENVRVRVLGRGGEITDIMRRMREVPEAERPAIGQLANQIKRDIEARIEALAGLPSPGGAGEIAQRGEYRCHPARRAHPARAASSGDADHGADARHLRRDGLRGRLHPRYRGRLPQFRGAQLSARPSGARDAGQFLPERRAAAPHAHLQRADSRDGGAQAAAGRGLPRHLLPARRAERARLADVPPDRGLHGGSGRVVTMANLKGVLAEFARAFYGSEVAVRFRASYFPFTEPSIESMSVAFCARARDAGCASTPDGPRSWAAE